MSLGDGDEDKLDESFLDQMNACNEREQSKCEPRSRYVSWTSKFSRHFWSYSAAFCNVDVYGGLQLDVPNRWHWESREPFDSRFSSLDKLKWWPYVSTLVLVYVSVQLFISIRHQYIYDTYHLRDKILKILVKSKHTGWEEALDESVAGQLKLNFESPFIQYIRASLLIEAQPGNEPNHHHITTREEPAPAGPRSDSSSSATEHTKLAPLIYANITQLALYIEARLQTARDELQLTGAPLISLHFIIQICYLSFVIGAFIFALGPKFYYTHVRPFNYSLTRAFLDLRHERRLHNRLILSEINKFIASSKNFSLACFSQARSIAQDDQLAKGEALRATRRLLTGGSGQELKSAGRRKLAPELPSVGTSSIQLGAGFLLDHILLKRQLKHLALEGFLQPFHKTAQWVDDVSTLAMLVAVLCVTFCIMETVSLALIFLLISGRMETLNSADSVKLLQAGFLVSVYIIPVGSFFIAQMLATCVDQTFYCLHIKRYINQAIWLDLKRLKRKPMEPIRAEELVSAERMRKLRTLTSLDSHQKVLARKNYCASIVDGSQVDSCVPHTGFDWHRRSTELHSSVSRAHCSDEVSLCLAQEKHAELAINDDDKLCDSLRTLDVVHRLRTNLNFLRSALDSHSGRWSAPADKRSDETAASLEPLRRQLCFKSNQVQMNLELIKVFMHYKIFVAQMKPIIRGLGSFTFGLLVLMLFNALNVRLHSPYMEPKTRSFSALFNICFILVVDLCCIPMCYMHSRCLELYKRLSSLLAHVVEAADWQRESMSCALATGNSGNAEPEPIESGADRQTSPELNSGVHNSATIWLLRKELNDPQQMIGQFAIVAYPMRLTYANLLRVHFWLGIVTLSSVVNTSTSHEFVGRLFDDPFGLFNWPPEAIHFMKTWRNLRT